MMRMWGFLCLFVIFFEGIMTDVELSMSGPTIVPRGSWQAQPPKATESMPSPVPFVVIHHSYLPPACTTPTSCIQAMQWMQNLHQITNNWNDIGYHFAVGGDGRVYEGRGWGIVGAHAPGYNNNSIGICLIGDWRTQLPPTNQLEAAQQLITMGIRDQHIQSAYRLVGHRQVKAGTECPGDRLFAEINQWKHFIPKPQ